MLYQYNRLLVVPVVQLITGSTMSGHLIRPLESIDDIPIDEIHEKVLVATGGISETDNEPQCINRLLKVLTQKGRYWLYNKSLINTLHSKNMEC